MKLCRSALLYIVLFVSLGAWAQDVNKPVFQEERSAWADSVLNTLTPRERIGQLFMVAAYSNKGSQHAAEIESLVEDYGIGGLIFMQGGPVRQAHLTNRYQKAAEVPLIIGMDAEWGLAMRLDSVPRFPRQMTMGALQNDRLVYLMGAEIARECRRLGVHINFAPVADVNNNPNNPVIGNRSFGERKERVTELSAAYMQGLQDYGVIATAKHFPGHGDTDTDSHKALPVISHSKERLDSLELYPFKSLIKQGLGSVMIAHLSIPSLDNTPRLPSTLSPKIVDDLLREDLGFNGLVITDAMNMKGVTDYYPAGEADLRALEAGNDIILFPQDVPQAINKIEAAVESGRISQKLIDRHCKRILQAKAWVGLDDFQPVRTDSLVEDLNSPAAESLRKRIVESALTLLENRDNLLPLKRIDTLEIATLSIGKSSGNAFDEMASRFARVDNFSCTSSPAAAEVRGIAQKLASYDVVLIGLFNTNNSPSRNFGFTDQAMELIKQVDASSHAVLCFMGNPYALEEFPHARQMDGLIVGYQDSEQTASAMAQALFGAIPVNGRLPVSVGDLYPAAAGEDLTSQIRLKYSDPQEVGWHTADLNMVDSIALEGLNNRAYPGCQIVVAKDGKIIYDRNFGYHTYENVRPVQSEDVYDIASITKMVATTASLMKLDEQGKFSLDSTLGYYLPKLIPDSFPHHHMVVRRVLAHQAGLIPWIPFYTSTIKDRKPNPRYYSEEFSVKYPLRVAENLYISRMASDSIMDRILNTRLRDNTDYKYSDLGFYFAREIVRAQSGKRIDRFVQETFYEPMGLPTMGYLPMERLPLERIIPTEYDRIFRKQLIHGDVHDPGAAMQGGVGGHAGVFSNARDLAEMMQMFINGGEYAGQRFLEPETIEEYTSCQFCQSELDENRRGAGFDKPVMDEGPGPTCKCVPFQSFGHSGFTGTLAWADPKNEIVYVFLSNRVYPTAENKKLIERDIRTRIQQAIYDAMNNAENNLTQLTGNP